MRTLFLSILAILLLLVAILWYAGRHFRKKYEKQVQAGLSQIQDNPAPVLTEADLAPLPESVQKYLRYTGAVGKPALKYFRAKFNGQIRQSESAPWMSFSSEQYNFLEAGTRLFFMKARMKGLPVAGFHAFARGSASMDIRLLSLLRVQYAAGPEMDTSETVTFFNDMCCIAPATLVDKRIQWTGVEGNRVKAVFTNNGISVSAWLHFNEEGQLINFISDDRYAYQQDGSMLKFQWSTPLGNYREVNGYKVATAASLVYAYPEGDFTYGTFELKGVVCND